MTTRVGEADDGTTVAVPQGGVLEIALAENASTGYRWELDPLPEGMELEADRVQPPATGAVGAAGTRLFAVRCLRGGTARARLRRPWEAAEPIRTFSVHVTASPPV